MGEVTNREDVRQIRQQTSTASGQRFSDWNNRSEKGNSERGFKKKLPMR